MGMFEESIGERQFWEVFFGMLYPDLEYVEWLSGKEIDIMGR